MKQLLQENITVEVVKESIASTFASKINAIGREVSLWTFAIVFEDIK